MRVCQPIEREFVKMVGFSPLLVAILTLVLGGSRVWARPTERSNLCNPVLQITPLVQQPEIDGIREESVWASCAQVRFHRSRTGQVPKKQTTAWVGYREEGLYVFVQCEDNAIDKIANRITDHDGNVWEDDCIEVFWGRDDEDICHVIVNSNGAIMDEWSYQARSWTSHARAANVITDDGWTAEVFLPSASVDYGPLFAGQSYRFNLAREEKELKELTDFSVIGDDFFERKYYGVLELVEKLPELFEGELRGIVRDDRGDPVSQARICWGSMIVISDAQGNFCLSGPGQMSNGPVKSWKPGYTVAAHTADTPQPLSLVLKKKEVYSLQFTPDFEPDEMYRVVAVTPETVVTGDYVVPAAVWAGNPESKAFAAQGQTVPLTFVLYAKEGMGNVDFRVSRFLDEAGTSLPEADVRLVRVRTRRDGYKTELPSEPVPDILDPLHPVTINGNSFRQVWITVEPSVDTTPGIYAGSLEIVPENGPRTTIPMSVRVLPFRLVEPTHKILGAFYYGRSGNWSRFNRDTTFAHYEPEIEDMVKHGIRSVFFCDTPDFVKRQDGELIVYSGFRRAEPANEALSQEYAHLGEGETAIDLDTFMWVVEQFRKYGMTGPLIQCMSLKNPAAAAASDTSLWDVRAHGPGDVGAEFIELFGEAIKKINAAVAAKGYAPLYYSLDDEIHWGGEHRVSGFMKLARIAKDAGARQAVTVSLQMDENELQQVRTVVDIPVGGGPYGIVKKQDVGNWRGRLSVYCQIWNKDFLFQRCRAGVWLWHFPYYCHYAHCYQGSFGDPWNDFDDSTPDMLAAYPDPETGLPIPTLHWEGFQQGFYDLCYFNTLEQRINDPSGGFSRAICRNAQQKVAEIIQGYADENGDLDRLTDISAAQIRRIRLIIADALVQSYGEQELAAWIQKGPKE